MGLIGFELGLFFFGIGVFDAKSGEIGFVLHKRVFLCAGISDPASPEDWPRQGGLVDLRFGGHY